MSKMKKIIWIPILIVAIIAVAVLVLSLIKVDPFETTFGGYSEAWLWVDGSPYASKVEGDVDFTEKTIEDGLATTKFSVMQSILEGRLGYKPRFQTNTDGEKVTIDAETIISYSQESGTYMLKFFYDDMKTIEVDGEGIDFDRVILIVSESNGEIREMTCIPYCNECVYNESYELNNEESEFVHKKDERGDIIHTGHDNYKAPVLTVKMITSKLMNALDEFLD